MKSPLGCVAKPCARTATEQPSLVNGVVVLSDPVHAPKAVKGRDMDVNGTLAVVIESAKHRNFFWVFLDHQMTPGPLEEVMARLPPHIVPVNPDQGLRLFLNRSSAHLPVQ